MIRAQHFLLVQVSANLTHQLVGQRFGKQGPLSRCTSQLVTAERNGLGTRSRQRSDAPVGIGAIVRALIVVRLSPNAMTWMRKDAHTTAQREGQL